MSKLEKTIQKMKNNPDGDWNIRDLQKIAKREGIEWRQKGSHVTFKNEDGTMLTVPARRPVKGIYIKAFVKFIALLLIVFTAMLYIALW